LTNQDYADRADYAFGSYRFFPGNDRTYEVGASYNF
jgi:iron complex outermembrane receptor protein